MIISAYCLSYGNWTVIPSHWEKVFADMKNIGFDAVDLSFSESEELYSMRTFELQVDLAHRHGLKVFAIPSRIGGRLAGAPAMVSPWLSDRPQIQVPGHPRLACFESTEFLEWSEKFILKMLNCFAIDGIIWDEPKNVDTISLHPDTVAKYGSDPTKEQMIESAINYFTHLTAVAKKRNPELVITLFNMPPTPTAFTASSAKIPGIGYAGFDGTTSNQSYFHEPAYRTKASIRSLWERTQKETTGNCGTFALIENILIPQSEIEAFKKELAVTCEQISPDHLSCYYYGHNNECAKEIQRITMDTIKKYYR